MLFSSRPHGGKPMSKLTVTTRADVVAEDGLLSLREALALAEASPGADAIRFAKSVFDPDGPAAERTIVLTEGELAITQPRGRIRIDGDLDHDGQADIVIDANGASRVMSIDGTADRSAKVQLDGLVITGGAIIGEGESGGGIRAEFASLKIEDSEIVNNTITGEDANGGGLSVTQSAVEIRDTTLSGNGAVFLTYRDRVGDGGGIYAFGSTLKVEGSTLVGNFTDGDYGSGAGIFARASSVTIAASAVSGNNVRRTGDGGGLAVHDSTLTITQSSFISNRSGPESSGGGLFLFDSDATLSASTISGNRIGGTNTYGAGMAALASDVTLSQATVSGNIGGIGSTIGGGIFVSRGGTFRLVNSTVIGNTGDYGDGLANRGGTVLLTNSIVAGNSVPSPYTYRQDVLGSIVSNGHNIFSQADVIGAQPSDIVVAVEDVFTTVLGPLADNGGPTLTHAPLPGSPAIDAGATADAVDADGHPLRTDQRGFPRLVGDAVDIGSVEFGARRAWHVAELFRDHSFSAAGGGWREEPEELRGAGVASEGRDERQSGNLLAEDLSTFDWGLLG